MNGLTKVNDEWIPLQKKVFTRWVNFQLKKQSSISDITKDLSSGVALVQLAKTLTRKNTPRAWKNQPKRTIDMVMNCDLSIEMFTKDGVNFVGISGKDVNDNNEKLILGLIWTLILHYTIGEAVANNNNVSMKNNNSKKVTKNHKQVIMSWANERLSNYPNIQNFTPYSLMLCALLDSYIPEKINYFSLNPEDSKNNAKLAINTMNELHIPVFVDSEEIMKYNNKVDEKSLLTQLSIAKVILDNYSKSHKNQLKSEKNEKLFVNDSAESSSDSKSQDSKEHDQANSKPNNNNINKEDSKFSLTSVNNYDINQTSMSNAETQTDSVKIIDSQGEIKSSNDEVEKLRKQLAEVKAKYQAKNEQLRESLFQSESKRNELSRKLVESEKMNKEESIRLSQILSESEKYKTQLDEALLDSEKQIKAKNNLESLAKKLALELRKTKLAINDYQKKITNAIEAREKMASELKSAKIAQADSEANIASFKEALDQASAKIAAEKETNDKINAEIESLKINQARSQADVALYKKALEKANALVKAQNEAKQKAIKDVNEKAEASIAMSEKARKEAIELSNSQKEALEEAQNKNKSQLKLYYKLRLKYEDMKEAKEIAEEEMKDVKYTDCQAAGIISSLRIAKERAERQAAEFKAAKEKAEKQAEAEKKEKIRVKIQLENIQAEIKRSKAKSEFDQEQKVKAEQEAKLNKKAKNKALSSVFAIKIEKAKAEEQIASLKHQTDLAEEARIRAEQESENNKLAKIEAESKVAQLKVDKSKAVAEAQAHKEEKEKMKQTIVEEREAKMKIEAELRAQLKEKENLEQQTKTHIEAKKKAEEEVIKTKKVNKQSETEFLKLSKKLSEAQKEAKAKSEALEKVKKDAEAKEYSHQQALLIAETEAERLGRALVFAESEAKRLSNELAKSKIQNSKENDEKAIVSIKQIEIERNARIHAENEAKVLSKALSEAWNKSRLQGHPVDGNNKNFPNANFGLIMTLKKSDYNNGKRVDVNKINILNDEKISLALTLINEDKPFLNQSGLKLDLKKANVEYDHHQQFCFGKENREDTIINTYLKDEMVWDVADHYNLNPPEGTPFYLFPCHGRHNQHFLYKDGMIIAQQNGQVVTYVGGQVPFVMMAPNKILKDRQTFDIKFF